MAAAGGGAGGGEDNPYSFNKFLKRVAPDSDTDSNSSAGDEEGNVVDLLENSSALDREESERNRKGSNENPFSFKRFLQSNSGSRQPLSQSQQQQSTGNGLLATLDLANDLPDFVHDRYHHYGGDSQSPDGGGRNSHSGGNDSRGTRQPAELSILPDFALDSAAAAAASSASAGSVGAGSDAGIPSYQFPLASSASASAAPFLFSSPVGGFPPPDIESLDTRLFGGATAPSQQSGDRRSSNLSGGRGLDGDGDAAMAAVVDSPVSDRANSTGGLPDFLSDSAIGGIMNAASRLAGGEAGAARCSVSDANGFRHSPLDEESDEGMDGSSARRLKEMNRELRARLQEARDLAQRESSRVTETLREIEARRQRDAEETSALESMIQQAEINLESTTLRATNAEAAAIKLKQEVKSLQSENELLRRQLAVGGSDGSALYDRALYASREIGAAASSAEQLLKQLLSGVDSLKVVADVLASADKFTHMPSDDLNSGEGASKGASPGASKGTSKGASPGASKGTGS